MKKPLLTIFVILAATVVLAQKRNINGTVTDAKHNTPVAFAAVFIEGSRYGTITNNMGEFSFTASDLDGSENLIVTSAGYQEIRIPAGLLSASHIELFMEQIPDAEKSTFEKLLNFVLNDWVPFGNPETNKFDFGRLQTVPTYNPIEGIRLRAGVASNSRLSPHFFVKGYGAYGFQDKKFKYRGEAVYSFNKKAYFDDEFPRSNLRLIYEHDIFSPGEIHPRLANDLLLVTYRRSKDEATYRTFAEINYEKDYYNGFGHLFWVRKSRLMPQGALSFYKYEYGDDFGPDIESINSSEVGITLKFIGNEAYTQQKRKKRLMDLNAPQIFLSHSAGIKDFMGGEYNYHKTELSVQKRFPINDIGRVDLVAEASKIWNSVPFPLLLYPNQRVRTHIDNTGFFLGRSLEFASDEQYTIRTTFVGNNLLFSRIPFMNLLQMRELLLLRASYGRLSDKNIPTRDNGLLALPLVTHGYNGVPYVEGTVGITNILGLLRVEYVHRFTHRDVPEALLGAIRVDIVF